MLDIVRKLSILISGHRRWPWILLVCLALAVSAIEAIGAVLIFALLAIVTAPGRPMEIPIVGDLRKYIDGGTDEVVVKTAIVVAVFFALRAVIIILAGYVQARVTQSAGSRLASRLLSGYLAMPYALSLRVNSAEQIRNVSQTVPLVVSEAFVRGARMLSESIVVITLGTVLLVTSPLAMAVFVLVTAPMVIGLNRFVRPRLEKLGREAQDLAGSTLQSVQESIHGLREIRVYGRERHFHAIFSTTYYALARTRSRRTVLGLLPGTGLETSIVLFICMLLVLTVISGQTLTEVLPVLGMFAYVGFRLKPALTHVVDGINALRYSSAAVSDLHQDLEQAERWMTQSPIQGSDFAFRDSIEVGNVSYRYPEAAGNALSEVNLSILRGSFVGIVGPTGGGKSTLLDILIGLLEPDQGSVRVGGVDIREAGEEWLSCLGVVPQAPFLLDAAVRENVALGFRGEHVDEDRLWYALRAAKLDGFVASLPDGVNTMLGERGLRLSGGQRQRIAIARALYREPQVLFLDEGTAALDNRTEADVMAELGRLRGNLTQVVVAHRLSTVMSCDVIHVVDEGRVVASGTYDELMRKSEHFRSLAR
jgi:ABC-type multidrug transport system fused ATPase/permease subunit